MEKEATTEYKPNQEYFVLFEEIQPKIELEIFNKKKINGGRVIFIFVLDQLVKN